MNNREQTREQLVAELEQLRRRVAELEKQQEKSHATDLMLRSIVRSVPDVIYRLDASGKIVFINEAVRNYGYDPDELIGTSIFELIHPEDRAKAAYRINERRTGERSTRLLELRLLTPSQKAVSFELMAADDDGEPTLLVNAEGIYSSGTPRAGEFLYTQGVARDITERKWASRVLEKSKEELSRRVAERTAELEAANQILLQREEQLHQAQKMEAVGQLTAGVAHHFNNMLQGIVGNIYLAMSDAQPEIRPFLEAAQDASERAADMIRQLMVFARLDIPRARRTVDLAAVVQDTVGMCRKTFDRRIEITERMPAEILVEGDPGQLRQVVMNLLLNACDAVARASGSSPVIGIHADEVVLDKGVDGLSPGICVRLRIEDNGVGMEEQTRRRVFEPFFTTKPVGRGTGLGLATSYAIVHQHGGAIECHSELGTGTCMEVYLPVVDRRDGGDGGEKGQGLSGKEGV